VRALVTKSGQIPLPAGTIGLTGRPIAAGSPAAPSTAGTEDTSGLCVSDPGGGWASDPLRDGLILTSCNTGPWQQFVPQSDGSLRNVATGLFINPNGTGAQLRDGAAATPWGGSFYTWTAFGNLPG
jgi:hypothetical protein